MSSPIAALVDEIVTLVEAQTPPSNPNIPYKVVDDLKVMGEGRSDVSDDRRFSFSTPLNPDPTEQTGADMTVTMWEFELQLLLRFQGSNVDRFKREANESILLQRAIHKNSNGWATAGIRSVELQPVLKGPTTGPNETLFLFPFRVRAEETD